MAPVAFLFFGPMDVLLKKRLSYFITVLCSKKRLGVTADSRTKAQRVLGVTGVYWKKPMSHVG